MKKIGIITHYYNNLNYGGNLQAYALCQYLRLNGVEAEQICFAGAFISRKKRKKKNFFVAIARKIITYPYEKFVAWKREKLEQELQVKVRRENAFLAFNREIIPHSKRIYNNSNIIECVEKYDAFITGSDQVWNQSWYNEAYYLSFVPSNKKKISYAASLGEEYLDTEEKEFYRDRLRLFDAVSVREQTALKLLKDVSPVQPYWTLDSTMLLPVEEWEKIRVEYPIDDKYLFCYFLGNNKAARDIAKTFSRKIGLKLVTIPHATGDIEILDENFGDLQLFDVSPQQFLSLIKNAEFIFTDSFHAVVFSYLYKKQYFAFNRSKDGAMSTRIKDITSLFGHKERFCEENMQYINDLKKIEYDSISPSFEKRRELSIKFLKDNLINSKEF